MELSLRGIEKSFGEKKVLHGVSLTARGGRALGLLGRNGAGKTTSIRILMGLFDADAGEVLLDGKPFKRAPMRFGYMPEERGMFVKQGILDQLQFLGELRGMRRADAARAAKAWLERVSLADVMQKKLGTLSKGNQQKVQLIAALLHRPDIVILDEPFSGLDPVNARLFKDVVAELVADGRIVLFSSHQMHYVEEFCQDVALLAGGRIVLGGALMDIKRSYPRNRIALRGEHVDALAQQAQAALGADFVRGTLERDTYTLTLRDGTDIPAALGALSPMLPMLDGVEVLLPTLEQIFIEKAGDHT